jgi:hypothetical protein
LYQKIEPCSHCSKTTYIYHLHPLETHSRSWATCRSSNTGSSPPSEQCPCTQETRPRSCRQSMTSQVPLSLSPTESDFHLLSYERSDQLQPLGRSEVQHQTSTFVAVIYMETYVRLCATEIRAEVGSTPGSRTSNKDDLVSLATHVMVTSHFCTPPFRFLQNINQAHSHS